MGFPKIQTGRYSYADYLTWGDDERCELINGFVHDMTAAPYTKHQRILMSLSSIIHTFLKSQPGKVFPAPFDVRLPGESANDDKTYTVVQPDISVFPDKAKLDERGANGSLDWIVEILSPSTYKTDTVTKLALYEQHGVREYWIIDPDKEIIFTFVLGNNVKYRPAKEYSRREQITVSIFPQLVINAEEIFSD